MNIFKEKAKIRERVQHIKDPTEREERILQIAVEEREDAVEKERARAETFKEELGRLRTEKVSHKFSHISSIRCLKGFTKTLGR